MDICSVIKKLDAASDIPDVKNTLTEVAQSYNFPHYLYASKFPTSFLRPSIVLINGFPQDWHDRYMQKNYFCVDPVLARAESQVLPFIWSHLEGSSLTEEARSFMEDANSHGLVNGTTLSFRGCYGETSVLSVATDRNDVETVANLVEASRFCLLLIPYLHNKVRELSVIHCAEFDKYSLSEREVECLRWGAEGKSTWEIGQILGVKDRTIMFHFHNICEKLNTVNRQQAIAKAITLGIIEPLMSKGVSRSLQD